MDKSFFPQCTLINISPATASKEDCVDLLQAEEIGKSCLKSSVEMQIIRGTQSFYVPLKWDKSSTFDEMIIKKNLRTNESSIALRADWNTFARLLI